MNPDEMKPLEKIETSMVLLDKLTDAQGRAKCGFIYIINEMLESLRKDVLVMEAQVNDIKVKTTETVSPE